MADITARVSRNTWPSRDLELSRFRSNDKFNQFQSLPSPLHLFISIYRLRLNLFIAYECMGQYLRLFRPYFSISLSFLNLFGIQFHSECSFSVFRWIHTTITQDLIVVQQVHGMILQRISYPNFHITSHHLYRAIQPENLPDTRG